jgi:hypothetical protein
MTASDSYYGLLAEFDKPEDLVAAARAAHAAGYRRMDGYAPFPIEELGEALGFRRTRMPQVVLTGAIIGCLTGYLMQWYTAVVDYPINIGGRPFHTWPAFIPITFEMTVLIAALFAVLGMLALNGLPMPYHPLFNVDRFAGATRDRFFLCIEATDPRFDLAQTREFLQGLHPFSVSEVPH